MAKSIAQDKVTPEKIEVSTDRSKHMGKSKQKQPEKLPEKLLEIRQYFNFTQEEMIGYIMPDIENATAARAAISDFEKGRRTPTLIEAYNYAVAVRLLTLFKNFNVEDLINDKKGLPWKKR